MLALRMGKTNGAIMGGCVSADPLSDQMKDLLEALRRWEYWYSVDSSEFNRDEAREYGLSLLKRHKVKVTT